VRRVLALYHGDPSYRLAPAIFETARQRLAHRILHFGYAKDREEYSRWLREGDIVVSTASHEFFGLAVLEAVRAGCRPLLPRRLSYPELFPPEFLYDDEEFEARLEAALTRPGRLPDGTARTLTEPYCLNTLSPLYDDWIRNALKPG